MKVKDRRHIKDLYDTYALLEKIVDNDIVNGDHGYYLASWVEERIDCIIDEMKRDEEQ